MKDESISSGIAVSFIEKVKSNEKTFKTFFGVSIMAFQALLLSVLPIYKETTLQGDERQRARKVEKIPVDSVLYMTLFWLREYPPMALLSILFNLHPRTAIKYIRRMILSLRKTLGNEIQWPTEEKWNENLEIFNQWLPPMLKGCISVVDGTEIRISRPATEPHQKKHYSVKKKQHSLNVLVIVLLNGEIIYLSPIDAGSCDQTIWNHENLRKLYENKPYGILGDGGFTFNRKNDSIEIVSEKPKKRPKKTRSQPGANLSVSDKAKNTTISKYRVVVENTIGQLKRWKILSGRYRHYTASKDSQQIDLEDVLWVCGCLTNHKIKKKPLRQDNWRPRNHLNADVENLSWLIQNILNIE